MKIFISALLLFAANSIFAQRVKEKSDSYQSIQEIQLADLNEKLLGDEREMRNFLDKFFADFTAHEKTKITHLQKLNSCAQTYCYEMKLDYFYVEKDQEKNISLDSSLFISKNEKKAKIEIINEIPLPIQMLVKLSPESWLEKSPILKKSIIELDQTSKGLNIRGQIILLNKVVPSILEEFLDDLLSSFYYHLQAASRNL